MVTQYAALLTCVKAFYEMVYFTDIRVVGITYDVRRTKRYETVETAVIE